MIFPEYSSGERISTNVPPSLGLVAEHLFKMRDKT